MKPPRLRWDFSLDSRLGRAIVAILGLALILIPLGNVLDPPDFYLPDDVRREPVFWLGVWIYMAFFGIVALVFALRGPKRPKD